MTSVDNLTYSIFGFALKACSDTMNIHQILKSGKTYFHWNHWFHARGQGLGDSIYTRIELHCKIRNLFHMVHVLQNYILFTIYLCCFFMKVNQRCTYTQKVHLLQNQHFKHLYSVYYLATADNFIFSCKVTTKHTIIKHICFHISIFKKYIY